MVDLWWTKPARRALETQLKTAMAAADDPVLISYPAKGLSKVELETAERYVRCSNHTAPVRVMEMGQNGRKEGRGFFKVGIFTKLADLQDANDNLAGLVASAFPYNLDLVHGSIRVSIGTVDHTDFVDMAGWGYSPVDVNWTVWRTY